METNEKGTVYIDCTNTVFTGMNTGIQRVVRNIIQRISNDRNVAGKRMIPVVAVMGSFYRFNTDISRTFFWTKLLSTVLASCRNILNIVFMNKYGKGDWPVDVINSKPVDYHLHGNIVYIGRKIIPIMFKCAYRADGIIQGSKIYFEKRDVLFLADAFWKESLIKSIASINNSGFKLIMLIYDLFPLTHPQFFDHVLVINYVNSLTSLFNKINGVISISRTSLLDVEKYLSNYKTGVVFDYFYLGADFSVKGKIPGNIRHELVSMFDSGSAYLAVGTIEPRKNYDYLLDAYQQIWAQENEIRLCIVGRVGWMCDDLMQRIDNLIRTGNKLFHFMDLNDDELEYCYSRSKAVVFPSQDEGFGLPLVEAMHYGKPVFASDIPVFREIGMEYPLYFDLNDSSSLADIVEAFENGTIERQFTPQKWLSWDESIEDLLTKVVAMNEKMV